MKVGIVGCSGAGLYLSVLVKKYHPDYDVVVFEKNQKVGRKMLATGNGKCNILNPDFTSIKYNNPDFFDKVKGDITLDNFKCCLFSSRQCFIFGCSNCDVCSLFI